MLRMEVELWPHMWLSLHFGLGGDGAKLYQLRVSVCGCVCVHTHETPCGAAFTILLEWVHTVGFIGCRARPSHVL